MACGLLSYCNLWVLEHESSIGATHGLRGPVACGTFDPNEGWN